VTYSYKTTTQGQTLTINNQLIGFTPSFQLDYVGIFQGNSFGVRLFNATSNKLDIAFKLTDFAMPSLDFMFAQNAAGQVMQQFYSQTI